MDDSRRVRVREPVGDGDQDLDLALGRQRIGALDLPVEVLSREELLNDIGNAVLDAEVVMWRWWRFPASSASRKNRLLISSSFSWQVLIATVRLMYGSRPRYTAPKPPEPIFPVTSYLPIFSGNGVSCGIVLEGRGKFKRSGPPAKRDPERLSGCPLPVNSGP